MQPLSPEPEPAAATQPGACMWPASLPLLPPHPLIHAFSPRSCVEPHIGPPSTPPHPRLPCPARGRCASRKLPSLSHR